MSQYCTNAEPCTQYHRISYSLRYFYFLGYKKNCYDISFRLGVVHRYNVVFGQSIPTEKYILDCTCMIAKSTLSSAGKYFSRAS